MCHPDAGIVYFVTLIKSAYRHGRSLREIKNAVLPIVRRDEGGDGIPLLGNVELYARQIEILEGIRPGERSAVITYDAPVVVRDFIVACDVRKSLPPYALGEA
jgi:hypothetical protein